LPIAKYQPRGARFLATLAVRERVKRIIGRGRFRFAFHLAGITFALLNKEGVRKLQVISLASRNESNSKEGAK
jgi:hypothetical protein